MHDYDVITRRAVFRNVCDTSNGRNGAAEHSKVIHKASSVTIDFEFNATAFHLVQLSGR
jgi:hypothetical protein